MNRRSRENYTSLIYNSILESIIDGELKSGEKLSDIELSEKFGVSRTPAREALILLERDGFVKTLSKRGTYVNEFEPDEIREIYIVREALESAAVRLGAKIVSDEELMIMERILEMMDKALEEKRYKDYPKLDIEFHKTLVNMSKVRLLADICGRMSLLGASIMATGEKYQERLDAYNDDHKRIYEALKNRDAELAEKITREHIQNGKVDLMLKM
jgi:DNA-binding GntR family transcriptional regulator